MGGPEDEEFAGGGELVDVAEKKDAVAGVDEFIGAGVDEARARPCVNILTAPFVAA